MSFFGISALTIPWRINPHFAGSAPMCGVPKNTMPYEETYIDRKSSAFLPVFG
jgi:hypothetical protein